MPIYNETDHNLVRKIHEIYFDFILSDYLLKL